MPVQYTGPAVMESYQTPEQCKAGAPVPKEYNTLIAQLHSQLTTSLQGLQQHHNPRLNETWDEEQWQPQLLKREQQQSEESGLDQRHWLSQEHWLSQDRQMGLDQQLSQEQQLIQKQQLRPEQQPSQVRRLSQEHWLSQDRPMDLDQQLSQEQQLIQKQQLRPEQQPSQVRRLSQEQWLNQDLHVDLDQQLSQKRELSLEQRPCQERLLGQHQRLSQVLSSMPAMISRMATHLKEFRTFDDAAFLFSLEEWGVWKEIEGMFPMPAMKTHSVHHVVQGPAVEPGVPRSSRGAADLQPAEHTGGDSGQMHETNIVKCYDSGDGRKSETSCQDQSLNELNTKISVKYPEKKGRKMPPDKSRFIKEGLKKLLCANRKTPSILQGSQEKPPTRPVLTGNGTDTISAATLDLDGDKEQCSFKGPTICYDCGKIFFSPVRLFRHQEMHRALKPYHCSVCEDPFFSQTHLLRHQEIHPELKPYNCSECGKLLISQELLLRHQEMHHVRKLYNSTDCGKLYLSQELLHRHQETHRVQKPYHCTECGKICFSEAMLLRHKKKHCTVKPYNCTECGKSFKTQSRFHNHQSSHTGVKAVECPVCGMRFIRKGLLLQHSRTHPGGKSPPDIVFEPNQAIALGSLPEEDPYWSSSPDLYSFATSSTTEAPSSSVSWQVDPQLPSSSSGRPARNTRPPNWIKDYTMDLLDCSI